MTGASKNTIAKLLIALGSVCSEYLNKTLVNLPCKRIQCDEIWSFVGCKEKNVTLEKIGRDGLVGDVWTWVAMDADTKLICSWMVRDRSSEPLSRLFRISLNGWQIAYNSLRTAIVFT
jgi:hypothetical protein